MPSTDTTLAARHPGCPATVTARAFALLGAIPHSLVAFLARLSVAAIFWQSGQTKVSGFSVNDTAIFLFENEYRLPLIDPAIAAHLAAFAEHLFPVLLVVGLASRMAALALLCMTLVIQVFVYPGAWPTHASWATCLLVVIARGPGVLSLDHLIARRFHRV